MTHTAAAPFFPHNPVHPFFTFRHYLFLLKQPQGLAFQGQQVHTSGGEEMLRQNELSLWC